jgi:leucyl aminopeptidase
VVSSFIGIGINAERAAHLVVEGMQLGLYRFEKYQTSTERRRVFMDEIIFLPEGDNAAMLEKGAVAGGNLARATNFARDLVNEPANKLYPENFAELTKTVCEKSGISVEIYDEKWLEEKGMNLHLAVGRASKRPPRLVILRYAPPTAKKHVGLVGKGITFDTGGYQIKTDNSMWRMNSDMGGAAAVIGAVIAAADANLNVKITAALPMAENMIDGTGYLPGDVITSYSGKTVEILNTDAEGRLLLADSISWMVREEKVEQLIDIATLTGSIVMALGHQMSGLFSSNDQVAEDLQASGVKSGESLWRMPLHNDYLLQLKSNVADLENIGGRPAGSITAAMFLREFTDGIPWAHIDIAGTATMDSAVFAYYKCPYYPKEGATGVGTRLLFHYLEKNAC